MAKAKQGLLSSVSDLNSATIIVDEPSLAYIAHKLIIRRVEALGGEITRLSNDFFCNGYVNDRMSKPPYIHLNWQLKGHLFEVLITFHSISLAAEAIERFSNLAYAKCVQEVLKPAFRPDDDEMAT